MIRDYEVVRLALLSLFVVGLAGCAGQGTRDTSTAAIPVATDAANAHWLTGTWRGDFYQTGIGDAGLVTGDIDCQINDDGTYKLVWSTRLVAGSSRENRMEMRGSVTASGNSAVFDDSKGARLTLQRSGDKLYGIWRDPNGKRANVQVQMTKVSEATSDQVQR